MTARFKRAISGNIVVNGAPFEWKIHREPQWCTADGWRGLALAVKHRDGNREAILQFPMPLDERLGSPQHQRPKVSQRLLQHGISAALDAGWDPLSKGRSKAIDVPDQPSP
jgi:hypothetical protein